VVRGACISVKNYASNLQKSFPEHQNLQKSSSKHQDPLYIASPRNLTKDPHRFTVELYLTDREEGAISGVKKPTKKNAATNTLLPLRTSQKFQHMGFRSILSLSLSLSLSPSHTLSLITRTYTHTHAHKHTHTRKHKHTQTQIYTQTHTNTHKHKHIYTHTHT